MRFEANTLLTHGLQPTVILYAVMQHSTEDANNKIICILVYTVCMSWFVTVCLTFSSFLFNHSSQKHCHAPQSIVCAQFQCTSFDAEGWTSLGNYSSLEACESCRCGDTNGNAASCSERIFHIVPHNVEVSWSVSLWFVPSSRTNGFCWVLGAATAQKYVIFRFNAALLGKFYGRKRLLHGKGFWIWLRRCLCS